MKNKTGVVRIKEISAEIGMNIFSQGNHKTKSYTMNNAIGKDRIAPHRNLLNQYEVSFFLLSISFVCFDWIVALYPAFSATLTKSSIVIIVGSNLILALSEAKFIFASFTHDVFLKVFSISNAHDEQCIHSMPRVAIAELFKPGLETATVAKGVSTKPGLEIALGNSPFISSASYQASLIIAIILSGPIIFSS
ncbi:MAG: hypothetical protein ACD_3C00025G0002 [uncultured bacterium (gcode 4)]|uniref:Uncharacterized protein n=1 Tax=uncultured bacterium (gcode 4) TaxID=1234023 RepID=K2G0G2_9BACT|nr:MAG: hypothetical protein ACD_3C00025G0002 [uncultured bacterium (gcode 4)]